MKTLTIITSLALSMSAYAAPKITDEAMKMVPNSKVLLEEKDEVKLQTADGGTIEIEFDRKGAFEEASGKNVDKDTFNAPNGLMSLKDAVAAAKKAGKTPVGKWSLEKGLLTGWTYEFKGVENNKEMEYMIDAKTGELKKSKTDRM